MIKMVLSTATPATAANMPATCVWLIIGLLPGPICGFWASAGMQRPKLRAIIRIPERYFDFTLFSYLGAFERERPEIWQTWPKFLAPAAPASPQTLSFSTGFPFRSPLHRR